MATAGAPVIHAPAPGDPAAHGPILEVGPGRDRRRAVGLPVSQIDDLARRPREAHGRRRKLALVEVIHRHRLAQHRHRFRPRHPREVGIGQQAVIAREGREIMAIGVAMALGIRERGIGRIDHPVAIRVFDIVIQGVNRFSGRNPAGVIPDQPVIDRGHLGARLQGIVAAAQKRQFFVDHPGQLPLEGKQRRGHIPVDGPAVDPVGNGRIRRVGIGLVPMDHIQIGKVTGRQQERIVGRAIVDRRRPVDRQHLAPPQNGLVDFNQPKIIDVRQIEGDVALPPLPGLLHQTHVRADGVAEQIRGALLEGIDARQGPLDPAFRQRGLRPF